MNPKSVRAIVIKDSNLLVVERWKNGGHYFSLPGGKAENNETPQQTVEREVREECSIKVLAQRQIYKNYKRQTEHGERVHDFWLCGYISSEPMLDPNSNELNTQNESNGENRYEPKWVKLTDIKNLDLWPAELKDRLASDAAHDFDEVVDLSD